MGPDGSLNSIDLLINSSHEDRNIDIIILLEIVPSLTQCAVRNTYMTIRTKTVYVHEHWLFRIKMQFFIRPALIFFSLWDYNGFNFS